MVHHYSFYSFPYEGIKAAELFFKTAKRTSFFLRIRQFHFYQPVRTMT
jgi:hypothetical protein